VSFQPNWISFVGLPFHLSQTEKRITLGCVSVCVYACIWGSSCSFIFVRFTQKHSVETGSRAIGKPARMELQWLNLLVKKTSKMLAGALQDKGREKFRKSRRLQ